MAEQLQERQGHRRRCRVLRLHPALRLAEYDVFETVVLTDIVEGKPEGLAST
jgi:hypothetical protein